MDYIEIVELLKSNTKGIISEYPEAKQPFVVVEKEEILAICKELHSNEKLYFDHLACITGVDNGEKDGTIDVIYHFTSIPFGHTFVIKVIVDRDLDKNPSIHTITPIYKGADWHERECYDFYGVKFDNHPDLRRILLPANWEGFPMRKDYSEQDYYHGIKVKY